MKEKDKLKIQTNENIGPFTNRAFNKLQTDE